MNILSNLQQIANIIIRPSRYTYKITDLGNKCFKLQDKEIRREDFQLKNPRGLKIKCSLYTSAKDYKQIQKCIIYLHCNSGCRVQGLAYLKQALDQNYSYVVFDFTGSGLSQGKYVSLGFYETIDLQCVYSHVRQIMSQKTKIILWGRSMGAVTGLNFLLHKKHNISFAIFDSPFKSLKGLFIQIGKQKTSFPEFILQMAYNYLKPIIQEKAGFNIEEVDLKLQNNSTNCPCVFIASKQDNLVPFQQIDEIFTLYKGQKEMHFIQQGHNEARNQKIINQVFKSLKKFILQQEISSKLKLQQLQQQKRNYHSHIGQKINNINEKGQKKQLSRKKLQLTIKSLSHRQLLTTMVGKVVLLKDQELLQQRRVSNLGMFQSRQNNNVIRLRVREENNPSLEKNLNPLSSNQQNNIANQKSLQQTPNPMLQKKPLSCLLPQQKKSLKALFIEESEINRFSFQPQTQRKILHINKSESKLKIKKKPMQLKNFFGNENCINRSKEIYRQKDQNIREEKTQRIHYQKVQNQIKYHPLAQRKFDDNILSSRQLGPKHQVARTIPLIQPLKPLQQYRSPNFQQENLTATKKIKPSSFNQSIRINIQSLQLHKEKQEPHSDIKTQSHTKNRINIHEDFFREKQFLKRSESLQKVLKIQNINDRKVINQPVTQTYREIKCTERVLQKIIEKQERKLLIFNQQQQGNNSKNQMKRTKNLQANEKNENHQKPEHSQRQQNQNPLKKQSQRKTLQQIVNKTKPFVELKGIKNYRNSFEGKYKTEIRK